MRLSPLAYRRVTLVALVALAFIVVTGAAVRLTGSGLGCTDWPTCEQGQLAPAEITDAPAMIEFVNRTITGVVSVAVIVAVLGSLLRTPRRRDLTWLSLGLVAGVLAQAILGAFVVLLDLSPRLVMGHFLLSMLLVWNAVVLHVRAGRPDGALSTNVSSDVLAIGRLLVGAAGVVVFTGTVVSASGPHAGDAQADRLPFVVRDVARIHSVSVFFLLALTLALLRYLHRDRAPDAHQAPVRVLLAVLVAQAGVGYVQYFTGVPALLVGVHVLGALSVWVAAIRVPLGMREVGGRVVDVGPSPQRPRALAVP